MILKAKTITPNNGIIVKLGRLPISLFIQEENINV